MRYRRQQSEESDSTEFYFWPSFTDLMSATVLVIVLLMFLAFVQNIVLSKQTGVAQKELGDLINVKLEMLQELQLTSLAPGQVTGDEGQISISDSGSILIKDDVFFDLGSAQLKPESREILKKLAGRFVALLEQERFRQYIAAILVEGHTDNTGSDERNWELSAQRALAVVKYLHSCNPRLAQEYAQYFGAVGYSKFKPANPGLTVAEANRTAADRARNRRIEIQIVLREEKVVEAVQELLHR